jgi:chromosome segregation ATPase
MLWLEIDSLREQAQTLTDTVSTVMQNVATISGAIQALAANDNAHLQRLDQLTIDVREIRARLDQQTQAQIERIGQATADALKGDMTTERTQAQRVIQMRADLQSWMGYLIVGGMGALLSYLLAHH